jgi:beta-glucosidase
MMEATLADANSIAGLESGSLDNDKVERVPGTKVQSDETPEFDALLRHQKPGCKSLVEELRDRLPEVEVVYAYGYPVAGTDVSHLPEALETAKDADLILMTLGGKNGSCSVATMGEGVDGTDINLPKCQDAAITELAKLGIPMVGIHLDGRPISSDIADEKLDAIIEAWSPAEAGAQAIVDVLTGDYNPGGKLPVSVARSSGQIGVYYNHYNGSAWHQGDSIGFANYVDMSHTPRYYFGYGLSYTSFSYQDIRLECTKQQVGDADAAGTAKTGTTGDGTTLQISPEGAFSVSFTLTNTGAVAGDEVVQMYVTDEHASVNRPVKELAGFVRVHLDAGESRQVAFTMQVSQMAFVDRQGKWKVEKGGFIIEIGSASNDIRLTEHVTITEDAYIDPKDRGFYAAAEVR